MAKEHPIYWYLANSNQPIFEQGEVLELAGKRLPPATLQNWANRGIVKPQPGGNRRRYSTWDLGHVCVGLPLVLDFNIPPSHAFAMVDQGVMRIMRNLVSRTSNLDADDIPISKVQEYFCIYTPANGASATITHRRKIRHSEFENSFASIVMPFGRLLVDLATRAKSLAEDADRDFIDASTLTFDEIAQSAMVPFHAEVASMKSDIAAMRAQLTASGS